VIPFTIYYQLKFFGQVVIYHGIRGGISKFDQSKYLDLSLTEFDLPSLTIVVEKW
jgi:hypothetical protein